MALCVCVALLPIIWVILSSFKTNSEIFSNGLSLPSHFGFDGYVQALEIAPILKFFANSLIVATITTILNVFCLAMAGYVFAKKRFRFKNTIFAILSLSMVIPTTALMSPVYNIITKLGLYDTKIALISGVHSAEYAYFSDGAPICVRLYSHRAGGGRLY